MNDEHHDIPEWFMPDSDDPVILGEPRGDAEKEHLEEENETLPEGVCPHCGGEFEEKDGCRYIHKYRPVEGDGEWKTMFGKERWSGAKEPAEWCTSHGRKRIEQYPFGYDEIAGKW